MNTFFQSALFGAALLFASNAVKADVPENPPADAKHYSEISYLGDDHIEGVLIGEITATIRKGHRSFDREVALVDDNTGESKATLIVEKVEYISFDEISDALAAKSSAGTMDADEVRAFLVDEIYGDEIKNAPISAIYFRLK